MMWPMAQSTSGYIRLQGGLLVEAMQATQWMNYQNISECIQLTIDVISTKIKSSSNKVFLFHCPWLPSCTSRVRQCLLVRHRGPSKTWRDGVVLQFNRIKWLFYFRKKKRTSDHLAWVLESSCENSTRWPQPQAKNFHCGNGKCQRGIAPPTPDWLKHHLTWKVCAYQISLNHQLWRSKS